MANTGQPFTRVAAFVRNMAGPQAHRPRGCSIHVHELHKLLWDLPPRYTSSPAASRWEHNQYAVELYLQRVLRPGHPWLATSAKSADVILTATNFSLWCFLGKGRSASRLWQEAVRKDILWPRPRSGTRAVMLMPHTYSQCPPPSDLATQNVTALVEYARRPRDVRNGLTVVSPFVVSEPGWLVQPAGSRATRPTGHARVVWAARSGRLIFMAGHVPKIGFRRTRFRLWQQLQREPRATVLSPTLACSVGSYHVCRMDDGFLQRQNKTFFDSFCHPFCGTHLGASQPLGTKWSRKLNRSKISRVHCGGPMNKRVTAAVMYRNLRSACKAHDPLDVDFAAVLPAMVRDTRRLTHSAYLESAMSHRFCLIAPGDFVSTHKISESIVIGGAGGCIPVIVLPRVLKDGGGQTGRSDRSLGPSVAMHLPYSRWLDYCSIAYLVAESTALTDFASVLERLSRVTSEEAAAKHAALRVVREAFVFRFGSTPEQPTAAEYILDEACALARRSSNPMPVAGGDHGKCTLG